MNNGSTLRLVEQPLQSILPGSRADKATAAFPFYKRCVLTHVGDSDAKLVKNTYAAYVTVNVGQDDRGVCYPSRDTVRECSELGHRRFKRGHKLLVDGGHIHVRQRGQGRTAAVTVIVAPLPVAVVEAQPGPPVVPPSPDHRGSRLARTPGGPTEVTVKGTVKGTEVAAEPGPRARGGEPAGGGQQQQLPVGRETTRDELRLDGLIAVCAVRSRKAGLNWSEASARRKIKDGILSVEALQELADYLEAKAKPVRVRL